MNARVLSLAGRAVRPSTRCLVLRTPMQRRLASSAQQPSQLSQFYKTFTRPVAKVLLMAFFTYQLAYWAWVKLETDEIMAEREAYIAYLEDEIASLTRPKQEDTRALQDLQMELMMLEKRNSETLAAMVQAEKEGVQGPGQQKTSSWWKIW